jgi:DNA-binding NarL/FixJ family response regulator
MTYEIDRGPVGEAPLSPRELEIAELVSHGLTNKTVARQLGVQEGTVKLHLYSIYRKLGVSNRVGLIVKVATKRQNTDSTIVLSPAPMMASAQ